MNVDEARDDGLVGHVEDFGVRRHPHGGLLADGYDAIVLDDDVGVFQDFIGVHRNDARTTKNRGARWHVAGKLQIDSDFFWMQFWQFFFLFLLLFGAFLPRGAPFSWRWTTLAFRFSFP